MYYNNFDFTKEYNIADVAAYMRGELWDVCEMYVECMWDVCGMYAPIDDICVMWQKI